MAKAEIAQYLRFTKEALDNAEHLDYVICAGWRVTGYPFEQWTELCNSAKQGNTGYVNRASRVLAYIACLCQFKESQICAVPLIASRNKAATEDAMPTQLARAVANSIGCQLNTTSLTKRVHRSLHNISGAINRDCEVSDTYTCNAEIDAELVILIDDFVTRGSTMNDAARAIRATNPRIKIIGLALGKTERPSRHNKHWNAHLDATVRRIAALPSPLDTVPLKERDSECLNDTQQEISNAITWPSGTPLIAIYEQAKSRYPHHLVFIQCGYFYELRGGDAEVMHLRENWKVTTRNELPFTGTPTNTVKVFDDLRHEQIPFIVINEGEYEHRGWTRYISEVHTPHSSKQSTG